MGSSLTLVSAWQRLDVFEPLGADYDPTDSSSGAAATERLLTCSSGRSACTASPRPLSGTRLPLGPAAGSDGFRRPLTVGAQQLTSTT
jgi:hypothetical protein